MNRFELWDKVAINWQYRWQQPFRSVVALWLVLNGCTIHKEKWVSKSVSLSHTSI